MKKERNGAEQQEALPHRTLRIENPSEYKGQLHKQQDPQFKSQDNVHVVNGVIEKADCTFLEKGVRAEELKLPLHHVTEKSKGRPLVIGNAPISVNEVRDLVKKHKIQTVFSLQTDSEIQQRDIPQQQIEKEFRTLGVKYQRHQISDDVENNYVKELFEASTKLNDLIDKQHQRVYLHCTSGRSRAPTLALAHQCLHAIDDSWDNVKFMENKYV